MLEAQGTQGVNLQDSQESICSKHRGRRVSTCKSSQLGISRSDTVTNSCDAIGLDYARVGLLKGRNALTPPSRNAHSLKKYSLLAVTKVVGVYVKEESPGARRLVS